MRYGKSAFDKIISENLKKTEGHREVVKAGLTERIGVKKVSPSMLYVNPDDEFSFPDIGPSDSIIENYCQIARRNYALGMPVFSDPIVVNKLRQGGYMILNGHHRWAGATKARIPKVRISIVNPD